MPAMPLNPDEPAGGEMSIALVGPDQLRRRAISDALAGCQQGGQFHASELNGSAPDRKIVIQDFPFYPPAQEELPESLDQQFDVIILDLDSDPDLALNLVEKICAKDQATVMIYSAQADRELLIRSMRAGAREFLTLPLSVLDMADALARVSIRKPAARRPARTSGSLFVFLGVKGGCGVTTVASNFAVALAQESGKPTLLIDLGLPLGDAALNLGMIPEFSTANAFQDSARLDATFLNGLLTKHSSGLFVLAAPREFTQIATPNDAIDKLLAVARLNFDWVVVDIGSRVDLRGTALFEESAIIYLITQVGVSELRNANRVISQFFPTRGRRLQIVINRYSPSALLFDDTHITKALTQPAQWKVPDDFATARRTQNTATPIALGDSPISRAIRQMARTACGLPAVPEKKKSFSFFG
jgi:pilus assembly protein CpaE